MIVSISMTERKPHTARVGILPADAGLQNDRAYISINLNGGDFCAHFAGTDEANVEQARELSAALLAAAKEIEDIVTSRNAIEIMLGKDPAPVPVLLAPVGVVIGDDEIHF